jgi:DNA-binding beta-propeller fold protein YncE
MEHNKNPSPEKKEITQTPNTSSSPHLPSISLSSGCWCRHAVEGLEKLSSGELGEAASYLQLLPAELLTEVCCWVRGCKEQQPKTNFSQFTLQFQTSYPLPEECKFGWGCTLHHDPTTGAKYLLLATMDKSSICKWLIGGGGTELQFSSATTAGKWLWDVISSRDGKRWIASDDSGHQIILLSSSPPHTITNRFGSKGWGVNQFSYPRSIIETGNNTVLIADGGNHRIVEYDWSGKFISTFLDRTAQRGDPSGLAYDEETGNVVVTEGGSHHRVSVFSQDGKKLCSIGSQRGAGNAQFNYPFFVTVHQQSKCIFVSDCYNHRICVLDQDLNFLGSFGRKGDGDAELNQPTGIAIDEESGTIYVVDNGNDRITVWKL